MGCKRTQRLSRFSKPIHACWDIVNEIRYEKKNKRFFRIVGKKKVYINFLCCKVCLTMFIEQCKNVNTSPCLPDVKNFTCHNCFK